MGAMALPAKPGPIVMTEADGTERTVYLHGDEDFHYMTDESGRWVEMQNGRLAPVASLTDEEVAVARAKACARRVPRRVEEAMQMAIPLNLAPRGLIILVEFSDVDFRSENTLTAFQAMFDSESYSYNGATGSAKKYFEDQSFGQYKPIFDIVGPVKMPNDQKYYGTNDRYGSDSHPDDMVITACQMVDTAFDVDFTLYDNNNDYFIDFVYVIYAGRGEADGGPSYTIWPHTSYIYESYGRSVYLDGKLLNTYACSNELKGSGFGLSRNGIGAFCHEFSHVLGLPDHYATNNSPVKQTGDWDLMCSGSYNNESNTPPGYTGYERFFMGWSEPILLNEPVSIDSMQPLSSSGEMYIITKTGETNMKGTDPNPSEFYMLENRQRIGWDGYIPGDGMLITKIDYNYSRWVRNQVNNNSSSLGYDIIEADGKTPEYPSTGYSGKAGDAFPYGKTTGYTPYPEYPITDIRRNNDLTIRFDFMGGADTPMAIAKSRALEKYGDDFTELVGVYDVTGHLIFTDGHLRALGPGLYIVVMSNGKKQRGVKMYIR